MFAQNYECKSKTNLIQTLSAYSIFCDNNVSTSMTEPLGSWERLHFAGSRSLVVIQNAKYKTLPNNKNHPN